MSPIEFALFLGDFSQILKTEPHFNNILFADDVAITCLGDTNKAIDIINQIESNIKTYLRGINMDIQEDKTIVMLIGIPDKINLDNSDNPRTTKLEHKHLGVTFDNMLFDFKDTHHPFENDVNNRFRKIITQRGMLYQIENMGYNAFRKLLFYKV